MKATTAAGKYKSEISLYPLIFHTIIEQTKKIAESASVSNTIALIMTGVSAKIKA